MERSFGAVLRLLAATAVVIAALGLGFAVASASSDPADSVEETHRMHEETHAGHGGMSMDSHTKAAMDEMHAQMSARLSEEDRALQDRMHEVCSGQTDERNET
ncbi:MAG: hypothetical protein M3N28_09310 [Actinomycetota bacterium]|nr:hypothetical protein [Actinomycetota bacterium]